MKVAAIIPARMAASRFPGKPLVKICGKTMIEHVYKRTAMARSLDAVYVATCDREIAEEVTRFGGKAVMTLDTHVRCTDRIAEAAINLHVDADIVVNVQGDEPLIVPEMIDEVAAPLLSDGSLPCSNLIVPIVDDEEFESPNTVKVVSDKHLKVLYMSREPIPSRKKSSGLTYPRYKQLGIIAFRGDFLNTFTSLPPTPLEQIESVDMMRAIEHGFTVQAVITESRMIGVDVPSQVVEVEEVMRRDRLWGSY